MKKQVKIILSLMLTIVMLGTNCAFANQFDTPCSKCIVNVNGHNYLITEKENEDCSVTRKYTRSIETYRELDKEEIEEILIALGMSDDEIESAMMEKDIQSALSFSFNVIYIKRNETTGDSVAVREKQALSEIEENLRDRAYLIQVSDAEASKIISSRGNPFNDTYMRISITTTNYSGGDYRFLAAATWKTPSAQRNFDGLGIGVQNFTINDTETTGFYRYKETVTNNDTGHTYSQTITNYINSFDNSINGSFNGMGETFKFPNDLYTGFETIVYSDLFARLSVKGGVNYPSLPSNFNVKATYDYTTTSCSGTISIGLDTLGVFSISATGTSNVSQERRTAMDSIHYIP